jgi:hypothetical protein
MPIRRVRSFLSEQVQHHVRFITADDICRELQIPEPECSELLHQCEVEGLVRGVLSAKGKTYYWLKTEHRDN